MTKKTILLGIASTGLLAMALPAQAALAYDADVTPNVIFGIGNGNGYFTVDQENGIELGLRAKIRYQGVYNSDGAGTYSFLPTDNWNIEWSINSDYLETSGVKLNGLTYKLTGQFFSLPGFSGDPVNSINPFPPYYYDHSFGNNSTAQGAGVEATSASDYANLIANYNVVQNSWSPGSPASLLVGPGTYVYTLEALLGGVSQAKTSITVEVAPVPEPSTYIAGALLLLPFGASTIRKLRTNRKA